MFCVMRSGMFAHSIIWLLLFSFAVAASSAMSMSENNDSGERPIHVFVLAGQSNMVGMGSMEHLDLLVHCNCSKENIFRSTLWNETSGTYKVRENVYIKFQDKYGPLTVNQGFAAPDRFGPELLFGWTLGDFYANETVFLIKTAYGGRTLAVDFRPPRSGEGNYEGVKPSHYGWEYREMVDEINDAIGNITKYVPTTSDTTAYQMEGMVWFQGWNDQLNRDFVNEYETNLANLLVDMRVELNVSDLPVVIGELGMLGVNYTGVGSDRVRAMRESEYFVSVMDEHSLFVRTAPFVVSNGTSYGGGYHYYGRADTYFHIGEAFGKGMVKMLKRKKDKRDSNHQAEINKRATPPTKGMIRGSAW